MLFAHSLQSSKVDQTDYVLLTQMQGLMEIFDREFCNAWIWTPNGAALFRIERDRTYWRKCYQVLPSPGACCVCLALLHVLCVRRLVSLYSALPACLQQSTCKDNGFRDWGTPANPLPPLPDEMLQLRLDVISRVPLRRQVLADFWYTHVVPAKVALSARDSALDRNSSISLDAAASVGMSLQDRKALVEGWRPATQHHMTAELESLSKAMANQATSQQYGA